jgi:hypothetical protein
MPQHVRGDNFGPVRQVHLGGTLTASSRQPRPPIVPSINAATQNYPFGRQIDRPSRTEIAARNGGSVRAAVQPSATLCNNPA